MARPSPNMRWANTGSGTVSSASHQPSKGARIRTFDISVLLPDLDPIERPHGIEPRAGEAQAQIMPAREARQLLCRKNRHARSVGRRRERQAGDCRRIATVRMNLELPLRGTRAADPNLGRLRSDFKVERQRRDGGNDTRPVRE